jgi:hypothetical protein
MLSTAQAYVGPANTPFEASLNCRAANRMHRWRKRTRITQWPRRGATVRDRRIHGSGTDLILCRLLGQSTNRSKVNAESTFRCSLRRYGHRCVGILHWSRSWLVHDERWYWMQFGDLGSLAETLCSPFCRVSPKSAAILPALQWRGVPIAPRAPFSLVAGPLARHQARPIRPPGRHRQVLVSTMIPRPVFLQLNHDRRLRGGYLVKLGAAWASSP